jgi:glycosyltransferase involved in cell wall biosynthesis
MSNQPLVSVVIAAYNADKYILEAVNSVLKQTYTRLELIVVNDGSSDGTKDIVDSIEDPRLVSLNQMNKGQDAAFNHGYRKSKGDFIKFFDADDYLSANMIDEQIKAIETYPEYVAYAPLGRFFNDDLNTAKFIDHAYYRDANALDFLTSDYAGPMLQCGSMLMHRSLIDKSGLWNEDLILFNDTEFFTRILLRSKGVKITNKAKLYYRSGLSTSLTAQKQRRFFESTKKAIELIEKHVLAVENSPRTRALIANLYQMRVYDMYPLFKDLAQHHQRRIEALGGSTYRLKSGKVFNLISSIFGWKVARTMQLIYNK